MTQTDSTATFYGNEKPLLVGTAATSQTLPTVVEWLLDEQRDLEIQDPAHPDVLDNEANRQTLIETIKTALSGYSGRMGIHGPFYGLSFTGPDKEAVKLAQRRLLSALDYAEAIGATHMVVHSPFHPFYDFSNPTQLKSVVSAVKNALEPVAEKAASIGAALVIENIEDLNSYGVIALAQAFDSPHVRLSVDVGHAQLQAGRGGTDPKSFINEVGPYLEHVHLQDGDGLFDRHWAIGDGIINWYGVMEAINSLDHTPRLIVETSFPNALRSYAYLTSRGLAR